MDDIELFGVEWIQFLKYLTLGCFYLGGFLAIGIGQCGEHFSLFRGSLLTSIVDICGCFRIQNLEETLNGRFHERRLWSQQKGSEFPPETDPLADISFIFGNNFVMECLKYYKKCYILQQKKSFFIFVDIGCIFTSIDEVEC